MPEGSRTSKGRALINLLPLREGETVRAVYRTRNYDEGKFILMATANGVDQEDRVRGVQHHICKADGIIALKMREDDELIGVDAHGWRRRHLDDLGVWPGRRFHESNVRPMGRAASGVRGMKLREGDQVIAVTHGTRRATTCWSSPTRALASARRFTITHARAVARMGVITMKGLDERGNLVGALSVRDGQACCMITTEGQITRQCVDPSRRWVVRRKASP